MGDSDDDYDRKRRDKFRGERNDSYRGAGGPDNGGGRRPPQDDMRSRRDDWGDRDWGRGRGPTRPMDYRLGHRVQPHEFSPPNKRPRGDWGDRYPSHDASPYSSGYGSNYDGPPQHHYHHQGPPQNRDSSDGHPQVLSFKAWLSTQDDSISDQDALAKYNDYKAEFKRQQLNEFFVAHREEEWFKLKYHPDECSKRRDEQFQNLKKRTNLFVEFLEKGRFDGVSLDSANSEKLIKLMDWFVVRLEDGTDDDAAKLLSDDPATVRRISVKEEDKPVVPTQTGDSVKANGKKSAKDDTDGEASASDSEAEKNSDNEEKQNKKKRKASESEPAAPDAKDEDNQKDESGVEEDAAGSDGEARQPPKKRTKERSRSGGSEITSGGSEIDHDEDEKDEDDDDDDGENNSSDATKKEKKKTTKKPLPSVPAASERKKITMAIENEEDAMPQLHRTASIFLRNLSATITKQEVESLCKKYPGFMRVAIADPQPEKRFSRRAWVTFKRNVNIKEICWNLNTVRLRDTDLGPIVNRDLSRRVRTVNGITPHKMIVRNDIRLAAKVIQHLDSKWNLWDEDKQEPQKESYGVYSTNPVLKNITDYLIEEASAEEEELLGISNSDGELDGEGKDERSNTIERDEELIQVLDRLLFYLRFVHSLDYYNHAEYPYEDEMPNRLGIIHGRGMPPTAKVNTAELQEYNRSFEIKISTFIQPTIILTDEDCKVLGTKDDDTETEKFITANTQELGKEKWLCPLSGKKFKGPEFVRKHILNKHAERLEEVKKEVVFFNNYLRDPKRPQSPEAAARQAAQERQQQPSNGPPRREPMMQERDYPPPPQYGGPYGGYGMMGPGGYGGGFGGHRPPYGGGGGYRDYGPPRGGGRPFRMGGRDPGNRGMVSYKDLDAPAEPDDY